MYPKVKKIVNIYKYKKVAISENQFQLNSGDALVIVYKIYADTNLTYYHTYKDAYFEKSLIIELNERDTFISNMNLKNSIIYTQLVAFSPDYGIRIVTKSDYITVEKLNNQIYIRSQIEGLELDTLLSGI